MTPMTYDPIGRKVKGQGH